MVDLVTGPITVNAKPLAGFDRITRDKAKFGKLTWRGGLVLTSPSEYFGGWSGLVLDPDGKGFFSISDAGAWMDGKLTYDAKGAPSAMTDVRMGAIQSKAGDPLSRKRDSDAEGLTLAEGTTQNGRAFISFERKHRITRYDIKDGELSPARGKVSLPKSSRDMPANGGFEAIAVLRGGANEGKLVAFSERMRDDEGRYVGWIWMGKERPRKFFMTNDGDYDITDAAALLDGSLLVLERRFRFSEGVSMRLRHIKAAQLRPGKVIDADILVAANGAPEINTWKVSPPRCAQMPPHHHHDLGRQLQSHSGAAPGCWRFRSRRGNSPQTKAAPRPRSLPAPVTNLGSPIEGGKPHPTGFKRKKPP